MFPQVEFEKLEKIIKRKTNRNNEQFSFKQLVEYSINKFNGYCIGIESESDIGNQTAVRMSTNNQITNNQNPSQTNFSNLNNRYYRRDSQPYYHKYNTRYQEKIKLATEANAADLRLKNDRIIGNAIFNKTLVSYLFDTGEDKTIINHKLYQKIKREDSSTKLVEFKGYKLKSCSSELKIYGQINLNNCQVTANQNETLKNVSILVTNHYSVHDCLLGRDILNRVNIPLLNTRVIKTKVDEFSKLIKQQFHNNSEINYAKDINKESGQKNFKQEFTNKRVNPKIKINGNVNEDLKNRFEKLFVRNKQKQSVDEFRTNESSKGQKTNTILEITDKKVRFENPVSTSDDVKKVRQEILNELKTISAQSVFDLTPSENKNFAFKIELSNRDQEPITTKCRPLPNNVKDKVKQELDKQLKAGIIRKINKKSIEINEITDSIETISFIDEQTQDADIVWIINLIKQNPDTKPEVKIFENTMQRLFYREYGNLRLVENVLYRTVKCKDGSNVNQFVLPKQIQDRVIKHMHEIIYNGHLGRRKTIEKITSRFYRPYLQTAVKKIIRECEVCQKVKGTKSNRNAELIYLKPSYVNELITTDFAV
ncbi:Retrovirus-related Pol poly from transposon [Brachionus plicatilis]|uniref:Retrovirus-related Pol poly from transposon n=1 Tax=Brachionus plicatilis TaxID=10195 RepID=A0A3M7RME9_BRAPC|nr:Retrovirus-related Pol poly from transposon [Brachionus plicatilis]